MAIFLFISAVPAAIGEASVCMFLPASGFLLSLPSAVGRSTAHLELRNCGRSLFFSGVAFWYSVRNLDKREDDLNNLPVGRTRFFIVCTIFVLLSVLVFNSYEME